ncbi:hypothetical protein Glove_280g51 [Diversispora epigaea]|uniref:Uncharacterized protein n=1 Tax=Diversispora epigaea TaxID=1348612 RepID=A0A397I436_9GLOM|nr:hypothetical protein Glove_280g51 [Diversispora epigaea]
MNNIEQKIQKLERWLKESEKHIAYLKKQIGIKDEKIDLLKTEVGNLKPRLKKALQDIENKDKIIPALKMQLIEMANKLSSLQHRIQKLRETITLNMTHLPFTNTPVFNLITDMKTNIKLLADSAREDNTFLKDEIDNFQMQAELKLTQIQNGCYTFENEVTQLRQEVINLRDINLNQQELTNELGTINETLKEQIDGLTDKNETNQFEIIEKTRLYEQVQDRESLEGAHENITEKFNTARTAWRNQIDRNRNITQELQNCRRHGRNLQNDKVLIEFWRDRIILRYEKWKNKTKNECQIIINLRQQIFALQNNPLPNLINMAGIQDVMTSMAPLLAQIPQYIGQEPPDDYINKVIQVFSYGTGLSVGAFNDGVKANVLKSKMSGKYASVPAQHLAGTRQVSLTKLTQEKFLPTDIPETYEERIRLLLLQTPNNNDNALAILWNHLPDELFSRMEIAAPADIDAFFTNLKNIWLKR